MSDAAQPSPPTDTPILKRLGPAAIVGVVSCVFPPIGGFLILGYLETISTEFRKLGDVGLFAYAAAFAILAGLALLPTWSQAILGGYAFGFAFGFPAALAGFVGGAVIGYFVGVTASGHRVEAIIEEKPKWRAVRDALIGRGFWPTTGIVSLVRLPPNSPFAITNLVMSSARVPFLPYLIGTAVGMAPRTAAAVFIGTGIHNITNKKEMGMPLWLIIAAIPLTLIVVAVIGVIATRAMKRVTASTPNEPRIEPQA